MNPIRVALIGYGKIARDQHLPSIAADERFELTAVVSSRGEGPEGVPVFRSIEALRRDGPAVDAAALCNRPGERTRTAVEAIAAGWHVLLEKPPAASLGEARHLETLATAKGVSIFATWHARHNGAVRRARELLAGRRVTGFRIDWREDVGKWHPGQDWVWRPHGFGVFDPGINALSILSEVLPVPCWPRRARFDVPEGADMPLRAEIEFGGGAGDAIGHALFDWSPVGREQWEIGIEAEGGPYRLSSGGRRLDVGGRQIVAAPDAEYPSIYDRFAELIDRGASDFDLRPLQLVEDCFLVAERRIVTAATKRAAGPK